MPYAVVSLERDTSTRTMRGVRPVDRETLFANAMTRISSLPEQERVDALLEYLVEVLNTMDTARIRTLRDQIVERFATCQASLETCQLVIDFVNAHLARRQRRVVRQSIRRF